METELNLDEIVHLPIYYYYYGASCLEVIMKMDNTCLGGWAELYNNYNEKMFTGNVGDAIKYIGDLIDKKYAS